MRRRRTGWGRGRGYLIALGVVAALTVPLVVVLVNEGGSDGGGGAALPSPRPTALGEGRVLGEADAQITVVDYLDFQCHFCRDLALSVLPAIEKEFVSSGQVKVEARPVAFLGEESNLAAQAAECAADEGRFWEFHDILFANQRGVERGAFAPENLKAFAERLEMDKEVFDSCLDSGRHAAAVRAATGQALSSGVDSVPRLIVNGQRVQGSLEAVREAILHELEAER